MSSSFKSVGFFFFAGIVFVLLGFLEKRITLVQSQIKSQIPLMENLSQELDSLDEMKEKLEKSAQRQAEIEEKLQVITLNFSPSSGPGEELVQSIVTQGLMLRHDLYLFWQNFIASSIKNNNKEHAAITISALKTLPKEIKARWLSTLQEYPTWDDLKFQTFHQEQESATQVSSMDLLKRIGVSIKRKDENPLYKDQLLEDYVQAGQYHTVCHLYDLERGEYKNKEILSKLCFAHQFFDFNVIEPKAEQ